ncbi:MAG: PD-(D/E)XK nuclease family protein [Patescibacteria group bacterium]|nr:PD-(D/E)XK nuclease family protein [Patescibacteria group bacterium]
MIPQDQIIYLSPSKLSLFQECPLCFWLSEVKGIHRPEGPKSTLPRGLDLLIKKYFDKYRAQNKLPPEIEGKVQGKLISDQVILQQWRSNFKNSQPRYFDQELKAVLFGALDECLVDGQYYIPVDYKTYGFDLKENSLFYYQTQLDCYTLLLEASGYKHLSFGYLIYYIPEEVEENGLVKFRVEPKKLKTDPQRAREIFRRAVQLLRRLQPESHSQCQFCSWGNDFINLT